MAGRIKRLPDDAKVVSFSLGGHERILLAVIEANKYRNGESGVTSSQIVADALWHYYDSKQYGSRDDILKLLPAKVEEVSNITPFPKKGSV